MAAPLAAPLVRLFGARLAPVLAQATAALAVLFVDAEAASAAALRELEALAAALREGAGAGREPPLLVALVPSSPGDLAALMGAGAVSASNLVVGVADATLHRRLATHCGLVRGAALVPELCLLDARSGEPTLVDALAFLRGGRLADLGRLRNCLTARRAPATRREFAAFGPSYPAALLQADAAIAALLYPGDPVLVRTVGASRADADVAAAVSAAAAGSTAAAGARSAEPSAALYANPPVPEELIDVDVNEVMTGPGPGPGEVWLPQAIMADLGLTEGATVSLQAQADMPEAGRIVLEISPRDAESLLEPAAWSAAAAAAVASFASPLEAAALELLHDFFGLPGAADEESRRADRLAEAIAATSVRIGAAEAQWLESHVRAARCKNFPTCSGATIEVPSRGSSCVRFRVAETAPRFRAVIVGPDTEVSVHITDDAEAVVALP